MSHTSMNKTDIMAALLIHVAPGAHDEALDDQPVYGPRGGFKGWGGSLAKTFRPAHPIASRAVSLHPDAIHHGRSYFYQHGSPGHRGKSTDTGPTFPDTLAVHAVIAAAEQPNVIAAVQRGNLNEAVRCALTHYETADRARNGSLKRQVPAQPVSPATESQRERAETEKAQKVAAPNKGKAAQR